MRGAPGSGKSYFLQKSNLEPYTLEADNFRLLVSNPSLDRNGNFHISSKKDKAAWKMLFECLEERMKNGDFTVIDATHVSKHALKSYEKLADEYKYTIYYYQMDTSLEVCIKNNESRPEYKRVPKKIIEKMYRTMQESENNIPKRFRKISSINEIINFYTEDITEKYENIKIIGDIHSCFTALSEVLEGFDERTLYIFLGDYLDRGIEHRNTLNLILELAGRPNVIMLEGNHEEYLKNYAKDIDVKNKEFLEKTLPSILENEENEEGFKKKLRIFIRKLRQCYAFKFHNHKVLCNHAGISAVPDMALISANEMINGVGFYETEISEIYEENYRLGRCQNFTQVFGHRGVESTEHSICLEGEVEFGGELKYLEISKDKTELKSVQNKVYNKNYLQEELEKAKKGESRKIELTVDDEINRLIVSRLINVKHVSPNLYSINFTRNAFRRRLWNDATVKARGLFVDRDTGDVKLRSYNKFFNFGENKFSSEKYLKENLAYPVDVYEKYNGFLGIVSVIGDKFVFATKTTTSGIHTEYLEELFQKIDEEMKSKMLNLCKNENVSLIFEVISNKDRHIVDYFMKESIYLLDIVENSLSINGIHIDNDLSNRLIESLDIPDNDESILKLRKKAAVCGSFDEIMKIMEDYRNKENFEGFVFTDKNGMMFKYKAEDYSVWKRRRSLVDRYRVNIADGENFSLESCKHSEDKKFMEWVLRLPKEKVLESHIIDLKNSYNSKKN